MKNLIAFIIFLVRVNCMFKQSQQASKKNFLVMQTQCSITYPPFKKIGFLKSPQLRPIFDRHLRIQLASIIVVVSSYPKHKLLKA